MTDAPDTRLEELGWDERWVDVWHREGNELQPGRVMSEQRRGVCVMTRQGAVDASIPGRFFHASKSRTGRERAERPIVGDWVLLDQNQAVQQVLPRRSLLSRKVSGEREQEQPLASNIDAVWIMMALDADFNLARLDRYLSLVAVSGAEELVLLSKADLAPDADRKLALAQRRHPSVQHLLISIPQDTGLERLESHLRPGRTIALIGSSGVGKSTLVNRLSGAHVMRTGRTRSVDGRGRHTTTHRQMHLLPGGGLVIDSPGMRELGLWEGAAGVEHAFADLEQLALGCRFRDCRHETEPGCALRSALAEKQLDAERFRSWLKLKKESQ